MRVRIFTTCKDDRRDLKDKVPEITITVPVGERGLLDVTFERRYLLAPIVEWTMEKGLSYEVHES